MFGSPSTKFLFRLFERPQPLISVPQKRGPFLIPEGVGVDGTRREERGRRALYSPTSTQAPRRSDSTAASIMHIISWPVRKSGKVASKGFPARFAATAP